MSNSPHRRKICEIEAQKENYQRHLGRLFKLKEGHSPDQLKRNLDQKRLYQTIKQMKKIHAFNRNFRIKQMKSIQNTQRSKQKDYSKIRSVVKEDIDKIPLTVASKHKRNYKQLFEQNEKILNRILQARPKVNFQAESFQQGNPIFPHIAQTDFSKIYQQSELNKIKKQVIKLNFGKNRKNIKICLQFNINNLQSVFRDTSSVYVVQAIYGQKKCRSYQLILGDIGNKKIVIRVPQKDYDLKRLKLRFIKILDQKEIVRGFISFSSDNNLQSENINSSNDYYLQSKTVLSAKGRQEIKCKLQFLMKITMKETQVTKDKTYNQLKTLR